MPNSATLVQALGAAFCAILCALSGMGGGGMMCGARTAAWAKAGAPLPYDYAVEYVYANANAWTQTDYKIRDVADEVEIRASVERNGRRFLLGSQVEGGGYLQTNDFAISTGSGTDNVVENGVPFICRITSSNVYVDGRITQTSNLFFSRASVEVRNINFSIFCLNNNDQFIRDPSWLWVGKIYSIKARKNGIETLNFVPCVKDSVVGLYETFREQFFSSKTVNSFIAGPRI